MERFLPSVNPLVDLQLVTVDKLLLTEAAVEQLLPSVNALMHLQRVAADKLLWTDIAMIQLDTRWRWRHFRDEATHNWLGS